MNSIEIDSPEDLQEKLSEILLHLAAQKPEGSEDERTLLKASNIIDHSTPEEILKAFNDL